MMIYVCYDYSIMRTYYDELKNGAVFHLINECMFTYSG